MHNLQSIIEDIAKLNDKAIKAFTITEGFNETIEQRNAFKVATNATRDIQEAYESAYAFEKQTVKLVFDVSETFLFALNASETAEFNVSEANKLLAEIKDFVLAAESSEVTSSELIANDSVSDS